MIGLCYIGDVLLEKKSMSFRIRSSKSSTKSGALWHTLKQKVDQGFKTTFAFKFHNALVNQGAHMNESMVSASGVGSPSKYGTRNF
jgi:hypothetical protein